VEKDSPLKGKTIRELNLREKTETLIIEIERNDESIINFSSDFVLLEGDTLLLAGEQERLDTFDGNILSTTRFEGFKD
jgi:CPA2 family monovalent cation:H+ antiporter-2